MLNDPDGKLARAIAPHPNALRDTRHQYATRGLRYFMSPVIPSTQSNAVRLSASAKRWKKLGR